MYYILFETGNERFFRFITKRFAVKVVNYIDDLYDTFEAEGANEQNCEENWEQEWAQKRATMKSYFEKNGKILFFFDCGLFINIGRCKHGCNEADRTAVLTTHQWGVYDTSMIQAKTHFLKNIHCSPEKRAALQTLFQYHEEASRGKNCETIETQDITPQDNREEYLSLYIGQVKKLEENTNGFAYIRNTGANIRNGPKSDFDSFSNRARLPNLTPCDHFTPPQ